MRGWWNSGVLWCFREKVVFMGYYGRNPGKIDDFGIDGM